MTSRDFWLKNTIKTVVLNTKNLPDYQAAIRVLTENEYYYHTYATEPKKTHVFILMGMTAHHNEQDNKKHLNNHTNARVHNVFPIKIQGLPLFLVVTDATWTAAKLQKDVPRVLRTAVQWDNR